LDRNALVDEDAIERLTTLGLVRLEGQRLRVLEPGMLLLDAILPEVVR
jgi:oxygen-independent coproporphyrinogen-3 oxidase